MAQEAGEIVAKLTAKQQRFVDEYLIDLNATQAAIRAGYSATSARSAAARNMSNVNIKTYIKTRMAEKESQLIADQNEILKYLTSVMRGRSKAAVVVVENIGDYMSQAREMEKSPDEKERLKAAELLGKRYGLFDKRDQAFKTGEKNNLLEAIAATEEIDTDDLPEVE